MKNPQIDVMVLHAMKMWTDIEPDWHACTSGKVSPPKGTKFYLRFNSTIYGNNKQLCSLSRDQRSEFFEFAKSAGALKDVSVVWADDPKDDVWTVKSDGKGANSYIKICIIRTIYDDPNCSKWIIENKNHDFYTLYTWSIRFCHNDGHMPFVYCRYWEKKEQNFNHNRFRKFVLDDLAVAGYHLKSQTEILEVKDEGDSIEDWAKENGLK